MALVTECDALRAFHAGQAAHFADLRDAGMEKLDAVGSLPGFVEAVRRELSGVPKPPPLRVVREDAAERDAQAPGAKPIAFKAGSISVAILTLMSADPDRTAPWSVGQVTEALTATIDTSRNKVGANLEHIFQRGALVKVPVTADPTHVYFKISAPWTATG